MSALATLIAVINPLLAFAAGVFFAKWMGDRRRAAFNGFGRNPQQSHRRVLP